MPIPKFKLPKSGVCRVCGCTDDNACQPACSWVDKDHTLCSACDGTHADTVYTIRHVRWRFRRLGHAKDTARAADRQLGAAYRRAQDRHRREDGDERDSQRG